MMSFRPSYNVYIAGMVQCEPERSNMPATLFSASALGVESRDGPLRESDAKCHPRVAALGELIPIGEVGGRSAGTNLALTPVNIAMK